MQHNKGKENQQKKGRGKVAFVFYLRKKSVLVYMTYLM